MKINIDYEMVIKWSVSLEKKENRDHLVYYLKQWLKPIDQFLSVL